MAIVLDAMMPVIDDLGLESVDSSRFAPADRCADRAARSGTASPDCAPGADDYIVNPFELIEVAETPHAALHRPVGASDEQLRSSGVLVDLGTRWAGTSSSPRRSSTLPPPSLSYAALPRATTYSG